MDWTKYKSQIKDALDKFRFDKEIITLLKQSKRIFIAGNGGSAATAMHYACDFMSQGLNAICLNTDISKITAIANDYDYLEIFRKQLKHLNINHKDLLILISTSGNSPNILAAANYAKSKGLMVMGISGFDGGELKRISDYSAHINNNNCGICEDVHSIFGHYLTEQLKEAKK